MTPASISHATTATSYAATYSRPMIAWLSLAQLISWGSIFYLFSLLMPLMEAEFGLTRAQASLAFGLALGVEGLLAYPVGRWIDAGHERRVMTLGSVVVALCLLAHSLVQSRLGFYLCWTGLGLGMACCLYSPVFAVVTRRFPLDYRRAIITLTFLGGLASTVFIPLIAWLFSAVGWRAALCVLALLHALVCLPIHVVWLKHAPKRLVQHTHDTAPSTRLSVHLRSPAYGLFAAFIVLMMAVTSALPAHMISLLREQALHELWVVLIPAGIGLLQVLGRLLLYFFEHRLSVNSVNRLIPCLLPLGLLALVAALYWHEASGRLGALLMALFVLLWGMGNGMLTIVKGTAIAHYISREHAASLNGALGVPLAIARALAPVALGLLWLPSTGYLMGLWVLLGLSLLGVAALSLTIRYASNRAA